MSEVTDQTRPAEEPAAPAPAVEAAAAAPAAPEAAVEAPAADAPAADGEAEAPATEEEEAPEEDEKSKRVTLADMSAKGSAMYAHKNYEEAAEIFSRASNLQAELNGELAPENAEILFHYGRSLFRVGQSKSDVLGGQAAGESKPQGKANGSAAAAAPKPKLPTLDEGAAETPAEAAAKKDAEPAKPLFQFTGDENFVDSDDEDAEVRFPAPRGAAWCRTNARVSANNSIGW